MGPVGDNEKRVEPINNNSDADLSDFDTQPVDDEILPLPDELYGGFENNETDGFEYLQNTVQVDEFFLFGDAFEIQKEYLGGEIQAAELHGETQPADLGALAQVDELCAETQQVDLVGDTQVEELCCGTQPVDLGGPTQVEELHFETQLVDLSGHTQVAEHFCETQQVALGGVTQIDALCGETQREDICGETQVLDDCETEVPTENNDEGGSETEVFCETQVISVGGSAERTGNCSVDPGNMQSNCLNKQIGRDYRAESDTLSNGEHHSGSMLKGFTFIRAASIRASGLAARNMAVKKNENSCSASDNSMEPQNAEKDGIFVNRYPLKFGNGCSPGSWKDRMVGSRESLELGNECKQSDQRHTQQEYDQQSESRTESSRRIGSSAARKLFMDDNVFDIRQVDDGMDNADNTDLPPGFASENGLGGLSYVDSQEPGELSQANALEVVDKIVKLNMMESAENVFAKGSTDGKSKPVSSAKGTQSLAKKVARKIREVKYGAFSWDDNLEDEGGGEFFQKKKELFFASGSQRHRSLKPSRKSWYQNPKSGMSPQENADEEQHNNNRKFKHGVLSDSRLLSKSLSLNGKLCELTEASFKKNLAKELDEEVNATSGDRQADGGNDKDAPGKLDVGLDTQMAADAIEALRFAASVTHNDGNGGTKSVTKSYCGEAGSKLNLEQNLCHKEACPSGRGVITRQRKRARIAAESHAELSILACKQSKNSRKKLHVRLGKREPKRGNLRKNLTNVSKMVGQTKEDISTSGGPKSLENLPVQNLSDSFNPVAHRTRGSMQIRHSQCGNSLKRSREQIDVIGHVSHRKSRTKASILETSGDKADLASKLVNMNIKQPNIVDYPRGRRTRSRFGGQEETTECNTSRTKVSTLETSGDKADLASKLVNMNIKQPNIVDYPRGRRTRSRFGGQEETTECITRSKISKVDDENPSASNKDVKEHLDVSGGTSSNEDVILSRSSVCSVVKRNKDKKKSAEEEMVTSNPEASPKDGHKSSALEGATPISCALSFNDASPICKGDEYSKQSCRKNLLRSSLTKEINSLLTTGPEHTCVMKDSRRRRDMANVRVLFSRHLDADVIKQQMKVLNRLGASVASSMSDASHFVTDEFVRTRNMLEAIAFGKPVVTHLWLESCGQASCFIDERSYILRDARKEKEFGFSMPVSLAKASQHPLLQGHKVFITPNTKPGKEILASLVKAVHGLAVERLGRSALRDEKFPDDILVLSCEEDYEICLPILEKGAAVYSSELLLNGIVTQRLDYERHMLFTDNVKITRSTIWLKRNNNVYTPVCRSK